MSVCVQGNRPPEVSIRGFLLVIVLLLLVRYGWIWIGLESFVLRDFSVFGHPLAAYLRDAFRVGEVPLWNPLSHAGLPYLAQWNTMVCYPPSLIYCLLPLPWSLNLFCLVHLLTGGLGMFVLARSWTGNDGGAILAGVGYTFGGLVTNSLMWPNNVAALGCLPWVVHLTDRAACEGGRRIHLAGMIGSLQMLSGAPEVILCTWAIIGVARCAERWGEGWGVACKEIRRTGAVVLLVTGLSAIQLLPFLELLSNSTRAELGGDGAWSAPWHVWANYLCPLFRGTPTADGTIFLSGQAWTHSHYLGMPVLVLALFAGGWRSGRRAGWLFCFAVLAIWLSWGEKAGLYGWLEQYGPLRQMRYPVKMLLIPCVLGPLLAAYGVKHLGLQSARPGIWLSVVAGLMLVGFASVAWLIAGADAAREGRLMEWTSWGKSAGVALVTLVVMILLARGRLVPFMGQGLLLGLLLADLWLHHPTLAPSVDLDRWTNPAPLGEGNVPPRPVQGRVAISPGAQFVQNFRVSESLADNLSVWRMTLPGNLNLMQPVARVEGFYSLKLPRVFEVQKRLYTGLDSVRPAVADFLGVRHYLVDEGGLRWRANENALPLVTAGQVPVFAADAEALLRLADAGFDPRRQVVLPAELEAGLGDLPFEAAELTNVEVGRHRVVFDVESFGPALAVVAQAHYPAWKVYIDGQTADLFRANVAFQAVLVPPGQHHVEILYVDTKFRFGLMISGFSLVVCLLGLARKKAAPAKGDGRLKSMI